MRFLVVGLGSMGKRRIRNLLYLDEKDIVGFDISEKRRLEAGQQYGIKTFNDFSNAMSSAPNVLVISTPPDRHIEYALIAAKNNKHFFIEAGVFAEGMIELLGLLKGKKFIGVPSCTMRFWPGPKKILALIKENAIGKLLTFTYHSGQYLPDWHPWEDYRNFYAAKRETGGCREIVPFELVWLVQICGAIEKIICFKKHASKLDVDIDDIYQLLIEFKSGIIGHLLVDVVSRFPVRHIRILGDEGNIEWDNYHNKTVTIYRAKSKAWEYFNLTDGTVERNYVNPEEPYIEEMRSFIDAIHGVKKFEYSFEEDIEILKALYRAEESDKKGQHLRLEVDSH